MVDKTKNHQRLYHHFYSKSPHALSLSNKHDAYQTKIAGTHIHPMHIRSKAFAATFSVKLRYRAFPHYHSGCMPNPSIPPRSLHPFCHKSLHTPYILANKAPNTSGIRIRKSWRHPLDVNVECVVLMFLVLMVERPNGDRRGFGIEEAVAAVGVGVDMKLGRFGGREGGLVEAWRRGE